MADPFLVNPNSLADMDRVPLRNYTDALDWQRNAEGLDRQTLADLPAQREMARQQAQANLASTLSMNRSRDMGTGHQDLVNQGLQRDVNVRSQIPISDEVRGKLSLMAKEMSDADLHTTMTQAQKLAMSADPAESAKGKQILAATYEMQKLKQQHTNAMELGAQRDTANLERANIMANASRDNAKTRSTNANKTGLQNELAAAKGDPVKTLTIYDRYISTLEAEQDPENEETLNSLRAAREATAKNVTRVEANRTNQGGWFKNPKTGQWEQYRATPVEDTDATQTPSSKPSAPKIGAKLSPQQEQAMNWAQVNPNDPRAQQIINKVTAETQGR